MPKRNTPKLAMQVSAIVLAGVTMLGASDPSTRFDHLGHQLMCTCSCGEILLECNHVGCPNSGPMITELHNLLGPTTGSGSAAGGTVAGSGMTNASVLNWFANKYGPIVLAAPIRGGFDLVAWIMPFAVLAMGIAAVFYFLRIWKQRHGEAVLAEGSGSSPFTTTRDNDLRDRIRRDTNFEA